MTVHRLKIYSKYFKEVVSGNKTFEVRNNDRDFQEGDKVILREYDGNNYTGKSIEKNIGYILRDEKYTKSGYVVFSLI